MSNMVSQNEAEEGAGRDQPQSRGGFGRMIFRIASELFGGSTEPEADQPQAPQVKPMPQEQPIVPAEAGAGPRPDDAAAVLRQALAHVESMPRDLAELKRWLGEVFQHLDDVLGRLDGEARRLAETSSRLADVAGRLDDRLADFAPAPNATTRAAAEPPAPDEPRFAPGEKAVGIVLAAVPGFQGLMDIQRALSSLPETEAASVVAFKNGEASIDVTLRSPITARQLVEGLHQATGHPLLIEEVRPEASRLRLRFVEHQGRG